MRPSSNNDYILYKGDKFINVGISSLLSVRYWKQMREVFELLLSYIALGVAVACLVITLVFTFFI